MGENKRMEVSMAIMPILTGEDAKMVLEMGKKPSINREYMEQVRKEAEENGIFIIEEDEIECEYKLNCVSEFRRLMQEEMKRQGITPEQMRKSLGVKKYEK